MGLGPEALTKLQAPAKLRDLGISPGMAEDLFCRRVLAERTTTVGKASQALGISHAVANEIAASLREKALLEYQGLDGRDYRVTLTELGFRTTAERMKNAQHVASMPIPIEDYQTIVKLQQSDVHLDRVLVKKAFSDMVVEDYILDQLGPAFVSGGAIFIYGPPGTGKTSLAERMCRFYDDLVLIPKFTAVDGQLISVFDPALHQAVPEQPPGLDPRYVLCERPLIMVGGELNLEMMDLRYDPASGLSSAPIQMLANNGILVVDDFGRQTTSPEEILNRWIIPLSRGVDFLKPNSGTKFTVPFELKLVVSTNLEPHALGDDAFLRRLRHKIYVGPCTDTAFNWILVRSADRHAIEVNADAARYLNMVTKEHLGELRPYVAVDFCELAVSICSYDGLPMVLDRSLIDRVADLCFVKEPDGLDTVADDSGARVHPEATGPTANGLGAHSEQTAPFTAMGDHLTSSTS
ncbi:MAG: AAA family ATPase [Acidimicrobiia bacterium]|nr:AAA family ATPase [Acidimicrobiia bacterium]